MCGAARSRAESRHISQLSGVHGWPSPTWQTFATWLQLPDAQSACCPQAFPSARFGWHPTPGSHRLSEGHAQVSHAVSGAATQATMRPVSQKYADFLFSVQVGRQVSAPSGPTPHVPPAGHPLPHGFEQKRSYPSAVHTVPPVQSTSLPQRS